MGKVLGLIVVDNFGLGALSDVVGPGEEEEVRGLIRRHMARLQHATGFLVPIWGMEDGTVTCSTCDGAGQVLPAVGKKWSLDLARTCPTCIGTGKVKRT